MRYPAPEHGPTFALGTMCHNGEGVAQDDAEAVKWYRKAAKQGQANAQYNLGFMYEDGKRVTQDHVQPLMWYTIAAAQGNELARKLRDSLAEEMTPEQIAQAQRLARER